MYLLVVKLRLVLIFFYVQFIFKPESIELNELLSLLIKEPILIL